MPTVKANGITMNYAQEGSGPPLILVPFLAAIAAIFWFRITIIPTLVACWVVGMVLQLTGIGP